MHIALEVEPGELKPMLEKGRAAGIESRGISAHGIIDSIYFRDPNGYVIERPPRLPVTTRRWTRRRVAPETF
jgi:catechol-2,3-dioxygenase